MTKLGHGLVAVGQSMMNVLPQDFACTHTQISFGKIQL